jgi:hypothetical protein
VEARYVPEDAGVTGDGWAFCEGCRKMVPPIAQREDAKHADLTVGFHGFTQGEEEERGMEAPSL